MARASEIGRVWSSAERRQQSERRRGEGNPFFGKKHTEKTRQHLAEVLARANLTHGDARQGPARAAEYHIWQAMRKRCQNPHDAAWSNYGGRGIRVCERWQLYEHFLEDVGRRPSASHSLDRVDNDGNYEHGNVRWATRLEQARNTRGNKRLTYNGVTLCVSEWAERVGLTDNAIHFRLRGGWSVEAALTTPSQRRNAKPLAALWHQSVSGDRRD